MVIVLSLLSLKTVFEDQCHETLRYRLLKMLEYNKKKTEQNMRNIDVERQLLKVNKRSDGFESAVSEVVFDESFR